MITGETFVALMQGKREELQRDRNQMLNGADEETTALKTCKFNYHHSVSIFTFSLKLLDLAAIISWTRSRKILVVVCWQFDLNIILGPADLEDLLFRSFSVFLIVRARYWMCVRMPYKSVDYHSGIIESCRELFNSPEVDNGLRARRAVGQIWNKSTRYEKCFSRGILTPQLHKHKHKPKKLVHYLTTHNCLSSLHKTLLNFHFSSQSSRQF